MVRDVHDRDRLPNALTGLPTRDAACWLRQRLTQGERQLARR